MAAPEERAKKAGEVKKQLEEMAKIDAKSLARTEDLSRDVNFSAAVPFFEDMLNIIRQLQPRDVSRLSTTHLNSIQTSCNRISDLIKKVREFTLNQNTPVDVCNNIVIEIKNAYDIVMEPLTIPLAFTATQATDYARLEREAKGYHTNMKEVFDKFSEDMKQFRTEAASALAAVKAQAAEAGVSTNAHIFVTNATEHGTLAKKWLKATITISSITLLTAIGFLAAFFFYKPDDIAVSIQYVANKIILLSVLSFGAFWCAKNYRAQKHNQILNQHRANALMTFRAFVEGTSDARVKDAILQQAAHAAFSGRPTGFDGPDKDLQACSPVVEIIGKSVAK